MQNNTQTTVVFTSVVSFEGRDGDNSYQGNIKLSELDFTDESFVSALVDLAANTLLHRKGTTAFKALPSVVDSAEFMTVAKSIGSSGGSRFKVTAKDEERAKTVLKSYEMAPEQTVEQFEEKYGIPFITDPKLLAEHYKNVRAAASKPTI